MSRGIDGDTPAFPGEGDPYYEGNDGQLRLRSEFGVPMEPYKGLTKREWLIGMAMQGLCANPSAWECPSRALADFAIDQADSILEKIAERESAELAKKSGH